MAERMKTVMAKEDTPATPTSYNRCGTLGGHQEAQPSLYKEAETWEGRSAQQRSSRAKK
jgi:hypothetical protein